MIIIDYIVIIYWVGIYFGSFNYFVVLFRNFLCFDYGGLFKLVIFVNLWM